MPFKIDEKKGYDTVDNVVIYSTTI